MWPKTIALVGNPNSGKSSLFNQLTGLRQKVGNYPGVTVDRKTANVSLGKGKNARLVDLPGTYSLYPVSEDERISCNILRDSQHEDYPDMVMVVADATQLRRSLLLCTQVMDMGFPCILVLNMIDLAEQEGIHIDESKLAQILSIPVVKISALKGEGMKALKTQMLSVPPKAKKPILEIPGGLKPAIQSVQKNLNTDNSYLAFQALLRPEEFSQLSSDTSSQLDLPNPEGLVTNEMLVRYDRIDGMLSQVLVEKSDAGASFTHKLDKILLHKLWGYLIFALLLLLIFQALFSFATTPMDWIENAFSWAGDELKSILPEGMFTDLLIDGVWAGLGGIVIFIPQIAFLFFFIAVLEESGYMSRVVFLMDRIMRPFGFGGRSVIPLIGGMACAVPSIMMARNIPNNKERLITIMVTPLMSCSARIPVYVLLIGLFISDTPVLGIFTLQGLTMMAFYLLGFLMALAMAFVFKKMMKYEASGSFVAELPVFRMPRWRNVLITIYQKSKTFVTEAGQVIIVISIILWFMSSFAPGERFTEIEESYAAELAQAQDDGTKLDIETQIATDKLEASYAGIVGKAIEPAIRPLGFDWKIGISLITSFAAREVFVGTMATIYSLEEPDAEDESQMQSLRDKMLNQTNPETGEKVYSTATALSLLIFYAFAMQCMSTLAVTKKETGGWKWTLVMLGYLTALAYLASLLTYQILA
ncbi:MAG: ferrous iron transport protein B [Bacteroidota bacterium]